MLGVMITIGGLAYLDLVDIRFLPDATHKKGIFIKIMISIVYLIGDCWLLVWGIR